MQMPSFFVFLTTYIFRMFQKFPSPNQSEYLMGDFSSFSSHRKQQLLLKSFSIRSINGPSITGEIFFYLTTFFRKFQKFHSPNPIKFLLGDFSKVNSHLNEQFLLKRFFFKLKNWTEHY
jgi:hypothetical protein